MNSRQQQLWPRRTVRLPTRRWCDSRGAL